MYAFLHAEFRASSLDGSTPYMVLSRRRKTSRLQGVTPNRTNSVSIKWRTTLRRSRGPSGQCPGHLVLWRDVSVCAAWEESPASSADRKGRGAWLRFLATQACGKPRLRLFSTFPSWRVGEAGMPWLLSSTKLVPAIAGTRSLSG